MPKKTNRSSHQEQIIDGIVYAFQEGTGLPQILKVKSMKVLFFLGTLWYTASVDVSLGIMMVYICPFLGYTIFFSKHHLALLMFWPMSWGPMITAYRRVRGSSQRWWNMESAAQMFGFVQQWVENGHFIKEHDDLVYVHTYIYIYICIYIYIDSYNKWIISKPRSKL